MWLNSIADSLQLLRLDATPIFTHNINLYLLLLKKDGKSANRWLILRYYFARDAVA